MPRMIGSGLSRREREILDVLHRLAKASVGEVEAQLPEAPSYSAVRTLLRVLEEKGHVKHQEDGRRYVYMATQPQMEAGQEALQSLVETFFRGESERAVYVLVTGGVLPSTDSAFEHQMALMRERLRRVYEEHKHVVQRDLRSAAVRSVFEALRNGTLSETPSLLLLPSSSTDEGEGISNPNSGTDQSKKEG